MEWMSLLSVEKLAAEEDEPAVFLQYPIANLFSTYSISYHEAG